MAIFAGESPLMLSGDAKKDLELIRNYIYERDMELRHILSHLDESNFVEGFADRLATVNNITNEYNEYNEIIEGGGTDEPSGSVDLENATGILPVSKGGTGLATLTSGYFLKGNGTNDVTLQSAANAGTAMCTSGSWTPTLLGYSGTNPTYTTDKGYNNGTGSAFGYYMKLGKLVMITGKISCQISDAGTGYAMIGNLPYKPRMDMAMDLLECFNCITITSADLHPVLRFVPAYGILFKSPNGSGTYKWKANNTAGGCLISFSGSFFTE